MPIFKQGEHWRYSFNRVIKGQRFRFTKLLPSAWNRARAEKWAREKEGELYAQASGIESKECLIDEAVKAYLVNVVPKRKQGKRAESALAMLLPYYEGRPMSSLSEVAENYVAETTALSAATQYQRLAFLKAACRYAYKRGLGSVDHAAKMAMPAVHNERQTYITVAQLNKLLACFDDDEARALVKMAFYTGLRWISELLPLTPASIKKIDGQLWLSIESSKNDDPRVIPVHPKIKDCLRYLPFSRSDTAMWVQFDRARKKAGMSHVRLHDIRHSFASVLVSKGVSLEMIALLLGHRSLASTRRYAHPYQKNIRDALLKVG